MNTAHSTPQASSSAAREPRVDEVDRRAGRLQPFGGGRDGGGDLGVDGPAAEVDRQRQAHARTRRRRAAAARSSGPGTDMMSASSGPWVAARNSRASSAQRASGPWWEIESNRPGSTSIGIRPRPGLSPTTPHHAAGMRTEPPMSLPSASGTQPEATAARAAAGRAARACGARSWGLRVTPHSGLSVCSVWANSGVVVWPMMTAPARRRAVTTEASWSGTQCSKAYEPSVVRWPATGCRVLDGDRHAVEHAERRRRGRPPARRGRRRASPRRPRCR